jgi:hypothetical protein
MRPQQGRRKFAQLKCTIDNYRRLSYSINTPGLRLGVGAPAG